MDPNSAVELESVGCMLIDKTWRAIQGQAAWELCSNPWSPWSKCRGLMLVKRIWLGIFFSPEEKSPTLFAAISLIELEPLSVLLFNSHMVYGQHKNFIDLSPAIIVLAKLVEYDKPVLVHF